MQKTLKYERQTILTPRSALESGAVPAGLSWLLCVSTLYCNHDTRSLPVSVPVMTESSGKPLQRTGLTVSRGGGGDPASLGPSTSRRNQEVPAVFGRLMPVHTALIALTERGL